MDYYLHRISHHANVAHPLLDLGILSIGWSDFATPEFVSTHQAMGWKNVPAAIEEEWGKMRSRFCLQRFLQMSKGDRVIVPSWGSFHVYDIASDKRLIAANLDLHNVKTWQGHRVQCDAGGQIGYQDGKGRWRSIDLGFFRQVKCVARDICRSKYADNKLLSRLKVRQTNVSINDLQQNVIEAIKRGEAKRPINLADEIVEQFADELLCLIREKLGPDQLEELIKWYFDRIGASSVETPRRNETDNKGDADIVATFEMIRTIIYVQAKHHVGTTGDWAVEQINSYVKEKELGPGDDYTRIPWVISTGSEFSPECHDKATQNQVHLIDGRELATRLLQVGIADLSKLTE